MALYEYPDKSGFPGGRPDIVMVGSRKPYWLPKFRARPSRALSHLHGSDFLSDARLLLSNPVTNYSVLPLTSFETMPSYADIYFPRYVSQLLSSKSK